MAGELFSSMADVKLVHVPFKGTSDSTVATIAGDIQINFISLASSLSFINAGKMRALAVTTAQRAPSLPAVPTLSESGLPGYDYYFWAGVLAPAAVPRSIIAQLNAAIGKAVGTPEIQEALRKQGLEPIVNTPAEFAAFIRSDLERHVELVKSSGIKLE
jgi:tripartite-type tricarboxylate transporter receptor subunit TctC